LDKAKAGIPENKPEKIEKRIRNKMKMKLVFLFIGKFESKKILCY